MAGPAGLANCVRWYEADSLALANAAAVSSWPDLSGNGATLTPPGSAPVFVKDRWNRLPGVLFPGDGSRKLSNGSATGRPTGDVTVAAVVANYKRGTSPMFLAWGSGSTQGFNLFGNSSADANGQPAGLIILRGSGTWAHNLATASVIPSRGDPTIVVGTSTGGTTKIRVDLGNEIDVSGGDTGSITYGGSPEISLGDKGSGAGIFSGIIYAVAIFDALLGSTDLATLEAYLEGKWRVTQTSAQYVAPYDGQDGSGAYATGLAWTPDGNRWKRYLANPVVTHGTGWESSNVKDSYVVWDGTQYVMYYSGWNGTYYQIGRATSPDGLTWTKYGSNPVIALGSSGAIDENGCSFPTVIYDTLESDPTRIWKMWYAATAAGTPDIFSYTIAYATSGDGLSWTKRGRVLNVGSTGAWDAAAAAPGDIFKDPSSGVYTLLYQGRKNVSAPQDWGGGAVTFTDPEGTYTRYSGNPTIVANGAAQALTMDLAAGTIGVNVADTSAFSAGDAVALDRFTITGTVPDTNRILKVDSHTHMTLEWAVDTDYPVADSARIVQHWHTSCTPRSLRKLADGTFDVFINVFQPNIDVSHSAAVPLREGYIRVNLPSLTASPALSQQGLLAMLVDSGKWDYESAENFRVLFNFAGALPPTPLGVITFPIGLPLGNVGGARA